MEKNRLITYTTSTAKVFNDCFNSIIKQLHIERNELVPKHVNLSNNPVLSAVNKFQNHPTILKIKQTKLTQAGFRFRPVTYEQSFTELKNLDMSKTTQLEGISTKNVE